MRNKLGTVAMGFVFGGALLAGTVGGTSCGDNNSSSAAGTGGFAGTGAAGRGGSGGARGGAGGNAGNQASAGATGNSMSVYTMQLNGVNEVPSNQSTASAMVTVTLDRNTGAVTVHGTFQGLTSSATAAHIHGPAVAGTNAAVIIPLTVPAATSGDVTGSATMSSPQMNDMINGMTYVNIHSMMFPEGEIRAQILP